jgi:ABC-type branched-subunit amino acid transport system substrate-binding protein/sugar lactone lactonase YvrE
VDRIRAMACLLLLCLCTAACGLLAACSLGRTDTTAPPAAGTSTDTPPGTLESVAAADGIQLTEDNVYEVLAVPIWHLDGTDDRFVTSYSPNGLLTFTDRASGELVDTGWWWMEQHRFCRQWRQVDEGEPACFYVVVDGTTIQVFDLQGALYRRTVFTHDPIPGLQSAPETPTSRFLYVEGVTVSTLAGDGVRESRDGPVSQARFSWPGGVAVDSQGNLYVAEFFGHRIRKLTADGTVSTLAGNGIAGYADGPGAAAQFNAPAGLDVDAAGYVYVADAINDRIRVIHPDGTVDTLAGDGTRGYRDGAAASAQFSAPTGVAADAQGFVYVADLGNHRIRVISPEGRVSTLAGSGAPGLRDGAPDEAQFNLPYRVTLDAAGNLYVVEGLWMLRLGSHALRRIAPDGRVSTIVGGQGAGFADGPTAEAGLFWPSDVAVDASGTLYVADAGNHRIRAITPQGTVATLAGSGALGHGDGSGPEAAFFWPDGIALDGAGHLIVTELLGQRIRVVDLPESVVASPPAAPPDPYTGQHVIKIGMVEEHPAPANIVAAIKLGAQLAVDEANAAGGVTVGDTQYTFALVPAQDWYLPPDADMTAAARRLVEEGVVAVVGHIASEASMAAAEVYGPAGVAMVSPVSSDPRLTEAGWWTVYRVTSNDTYMASVAARMAFEELGLRRAVLLGESAPHVQTVMDAWERAFESLGGRVDDRIEADTESAADVTARLRARAREVVVLFPTRALTPTDLVGQVRASDVDAVIVGVEAFSDMPAFLGRLGSAAEGIYDAVTGQPRALMPGYAEFAARYREAGLPILPDPDDFLAKWAPFGYDAAGVIIAAVRQAAQAGEVTAPDVAAALDRFRHEPHLGVTGVIQFDEYGDLLEQSVSFKKVVNGEWVDVLPGER